MFAGDLFCSARCTESVEYTDYTEYTEVDAVAITGAEWDKAKRVSQEWSPSRDQEDNIYYDSNSRNSPPRAARGNDSSVLEVKNFNANWNVSQPKPQGDMIHQALFDISSRDYAVSMSENLPPVSEPNKAHRHGQSKQRTPSNQKGHQGGYAKGKGPRATSQEDHHPGYSKGKTWTRRDSLPEPYPTLPLSSGPCADKQMENYWQSVYLDCMIAAGDVLAVRGTRQITRIGASGGMFGHVLLVTAAPRCIQKRTSEFTEFQGIWPVGKVDEIYQVPVIESTRATEGIHETDLLLYVDPKSGRIILHGEVERSGTIVGFDDEEPEVVELWQCPSELRDSSCRDLKESVIDEMKQNQANWSWYTAVRAFLLPAAMESQPSTLTAQSKSNREQVLRELQDCWKGAPICSSLPVIFWQRYLCKLSQSGRASEDLEDATNAIDLIMRYMPLKADRALPGDLLSILRASGWTIIQQLPSRRLSSL
mmetsp:Transcript_78192/g.135613  ORF Transcript_78192/g.135613 Transcript_78192/m.135613 type:complete len:479 (-) Transcript_78192:357-1793(-)